MITLNGIPQVLWPDHCVQGTFGAELSEKLDKDGIDHIVRKGEDAMIDSYSTFFDNGHLKKTDLDDYLHSKGVTELFILGLATDYCVKYSCMDGINLGYSVNIVIDGCRGIDLNPGDIDRAVEEMVSAGAVVVKSEDILKLRNIE